MLGVADGIEIGIKEAPAGYLHLDLLSSKEGGFDGSAHGSCICSDEDGISIHGSASHTNYSALDRQED